MEPELWVEQLRHDGTQYMWAPEHVIVNLSGDVSIDVDNVIPDMARQPGLVAYYGELVGTLRAEVSRKETEEHRVRLQLQALRRTELEGEGKRATKDALDEYVNTRDEYQNAVAVTGLSRLYCARAAGWYKAIEQKKDLLTGICHRQNAELKAL